MSDAQEKVSTAIREAANEWAARLAAPELPLADRHAFAAWLRASPAHVREYLNAEALRDALKQAVASDSTDTRELLQDAPSNVIEWEAQSPPVPARHSFARRRPLALAASVMLFVGIALALMFGWQRDRSGYSTAVGEIRRIALTDGSIVELNTSSRIQVEFDAGRRDIHLLRGEGFFTVAKDPRRSFRVLSGDALIQAIGTQFSVYRRVGDTVVTVVEGRVATESRNETLELTAGRQAVIGSRPGGKSSSIEAAGVDAARATAWRQHRLVFDNQPLAQVVAEFNRYNQRQLVIADVTLAAERISGVFDPNKPQGLLLFLSKKGGVRATESPDARVVLSR